jgi:hypothetical protein
LAFVVRTHDISHCKKNAFRENEMLPKVGFIVSTTAAYVRKQIYRSGAKHDRSKYEIITHNLYAVMLLQASKTRCTLDNYSKVKSATPIRLDDTPIKEAKTCPVEAKLI